MRIRHREENSPSRYGGSTFSSRPGDEVEVSDAVGERLTRQKSYFERVEAGTCEVVKSDGDVCGRDLPCQYHPDGGEG